MARPKKQIDEALVERLAKAQCSNRQIAGRVGVDHKTIADRFSPDLARWREWGKSHLAEVMWSKAIEGDGKMQIHLAKQHLGHSDKVTAEIIKPLPDPVEAYAADPGLMERGLQFERDLADASLALPLDAGSSRISGLAVPPPPPRAGGNGDETADRPDGQSGDNPRPG
jgi:hypothetical protein